ncbi:MAG: hypothetical protein Q7S73_00615, partial [bacterium]|nr:hypothetical protein [bacterium]
SSVIANGYVYVIGGSNDGGSTKQSTVYYAKLNSDGSTGAWSTNANAMPANRWQPSSVVANGYVYVIGGAATAQSQSTVYYAKLNSDGSTGAWSTNANALPGGSYTLSSVIANGYAYVIGGHDGTTAQSTVYYAKLNSDGSTGAWSTNANALPLVRYSHSSVVANGYVYVIGGNGGSTVSTVYYASTARVLISGNLDLLGLASTTLSDASGDGSLGSIGSSIFAGNIFSAGTLEVSGNTQLFGGLGVNGLLSVNASTSLNQNVPIFSIQNATGTLPLFSLAYNGGLGIGTTSPFSGTLIMNGNVGIGTTTPGALLSVQGNALFSGNLSLANLIATGTLGVGTTTNGSYATIAAESQNSTTTLYLASTRSDRAGCIQLEGPASTTYRMYIGDTGSGAALITQAGSCDGN